MSPADATGRIRVRSRWGAQGAPPAFASESGAPGGRAGRKGAARGPPRNPSSLRVPAGPRAPSRALCRLPSQAHPSAPAAETGAHRGADWQVGVAYGHDGRGQWFLVSWHRAQKT